MMPACRPTAATLPATGWPLTLAAVIVLPIPDGLAAMSCAAAAAGRHTGCCHAGQLAITIQPAKIIAIIGQFNIAWLADEDAWGSLLHCRCWCRHTLLSLMLIIDGQIAIADGYAVLLYTAIVNTHSWLRCHMPLLAAGWLVLRRPRYCLRYFSALLHWCRWRCCIAIDDVTLPHFDAAITSYGHCHIRPLLRRRCHEVDSWCWWYCHATYCRHYAFFFFTLLDIATILLLSITMLSLVVDYTCHWWYFRHYAGFDAASITFFRCHYVITAIDGHCHWFSLAIATHSLMADSFATLPFSLLIDAYYCHW